MDRDKFMELVYEIFSEEPDNLLANSIIEAADALIEAQPELTDEQVINYCDKKGYVILKKEPIFQAGYQNKEIRFYIGGRLFAIRELAQ